MIERDDPKTDRGFIKQVIRETTSMGVVPGVVEETYPPIEPDSQGEVDVRSLITGELYPRTQIATGRYNESPSIQKNQYVGLNVITSPDRQSNRKAYVDCVLHTVENEAPLAKENEWMQRFEDGATIESAVTEDGERVIRIGSREDDRGDLDFGLVINLERGSFEIYDGVFNGLCCDGEGGISLSGVAGATQSEVYSPGATNGPVNWESGEPFREFPLPNTQNRVNLNEEGLSQGDTIDGYLDDYFNPGTLAIVEPGNYQWDGGGIPNELYNTGLMPPSVAGSVTGDPIDEPADAQFDGGSQQGAGQIVLNAGNENDVENRIRVTKGGDSSVYFSNITMKGVKNVNRWFTPAVQDKQSSLVFRNVHMGDGGSSDERNGAMFVPTSHSGTIYLRNLLVGGGYTDNGVYGSAPGIDSNGGKGGRVIAEGGLYRNSNVAPLRMGGSGSVARSVTIINDQTANATSYHNGNINQRGIWVRDNAREILIEDCDFIQSEDGGALTIGGGSASETVKSVSVKNCRFTNNIQTPPIRAEEGNVTGSGNQFSGSGDLDVVGADLTGSVRGSNATPADPNPRRG